MDPPSLPDSSYTGPSSTQTTIPSRSQSFSQNSDDSHTAAEFIDSQLQLEADAREVLPYKFENCTKALGKLRQALFSCLTCNPPPAIISEPYTPAGVCYSCSIQCHGEHTLVELFNKRDFVCDCGTTRLPATSPCAIRVNPDTNTKGDVHSEEPTSTNMYNHNFANRFCGCKCDYDAYKEKGTMFQCLGLGTTKTGGCGEDWWHPGCLVGLGPNWYENLSHTGTPRKSKTSNLLQSVAEVHVAELSGEISGGPTIGSATVIHTDTPVEEVEGEDPPLPPGFPDEDEFEGFICYKCVDAYPWIKRYASAPGFLAPVFRRSAAPSPETEPQGKEEQLFLGHSTNVKKRKVEDDEGSVSSERLKRVKDEVPGPTISIQIPEIGMQDFSTKTTPPCKFKILPPPPTGQISLFFKSGFRDHLCRCSDCFPDLKLHNQLLDEEEIYEPSISNSEEEAGGSTVGSGSIYDRGESALKNVDRVRAIEGVMAYNHLKDKLKPFFQQFAESGKAISAEDIKAHFAKMRGDEQAIKEAGEGAKRDNINHRKEQGGY